MGDEPPWSIEHRGLAYCYTESKWTPSLPFETIKGDHSLADKCMYSEPILNSQFHNNFTMCKAVYMQSFDVELLERYVIHLLLMKMKPFM